jgi:Glutaminase
MLPHLTPSRRSRLKAPCLSLTSKSGKERPEPIDTFEVAPAIETSLSTPKPPLSGQNRVDWSDVLALMDSSPKTHRDWANHPTSPYSDEELRVTASVLNDGSLSKRLLTWAVPPARGHIFRQLESMTPADRRDCAKTTLDLRDDLQKVSGRAPVTVRTLVSQNAVEPSREELEALFESVNADPDLDWNDRENCWLRADAVDQKLRGAGYRSFRLHAEGRLANDWNWHVASAVQTKGLNGPEFLVIDPAIAPEPLKAHRWLAKVRGDGGDCQVKICSGD